MRVASPFTLSLPPLSGYRRLVAIALTGVLGLSTTAAAQTIGAAPSTRAEEAAAARRAATVPTGPAVPRVDQIFN